MKTLSKIALCGWLTLPLFAFGQLKNGSYLVTPAACANSWTGYGEIGSYSLTGSLNIKQGSVECSGGAVTKALFVFDMQSISHENDNLESHLKDEDFFDVKKFPTATFELKKLQGNTATGSLTVRNVKKDISFPVTVAQQGTNIHLVGKAVIDRTVFGIHYNSNSFFENLGDSAIKNTFDFVFDVVAAPAK